MPGFKNMLRKLLPVVRHITFSLAIIAFCFCPSRMEVRALGKTVSPVTVSPGRSAEGWVCDVVPELERTRGQIPLSFLLGWIAVESGGDLKQVTKFNERGYFQLNPEESTELGLQHVRLSSDAQYSIDAGPQVVLLYEQKAKMAGFVDTNTDLFWRMVKFYHSMGTGAVTRFLADVKAHGKFINSWTDVEAYAAAEQNRLIKKLHHDPVKWTENVDKVFRKAQHFQSLASGTCGT
jgi:hypothetical protein